MGIYKKLIIAVALMIIALFIPFKKAIVIEQPKKEKMLAYVLAESQKPFQIQYTHSIHQSEVVETYVVLQNGMLRQIELMYEDMAIGMPAHANEGEVFESKEGKYFIRNMKREFPSIDLFVGQVKANHRFVIRGQMTPFSKFADPGSLVRLKVKRISLWQLFKGVRIVDR